MPSLLESPPPQLQSTCGWGALYPVEEETVKPRVVNSGAVVAAAKKKPAAYSGGGNKKKNLETCTEALGCETGGVDSCDDGGGAAEEQPTVVVVDGGACHQSARRPRRRPLPPPLTTLALGTSRVRTVHDDGRLEVSYAVRSSGILEAERRDGRLRLRLVSPDCCRKEPEAAKEAEKDEEEEYGSIKYLRGGRCADPERGAPAAAVAARLGKQWEPEQVAPFWVATS